MNRRSTQSRTTSPSKRRLSTPLRHTTSSRLSISALTSASSSLSGASSRVSTASISRPSAFTRQTKYSRSAPRLSGGRSVATRQNFSGTSARSFSDEAPISSLKSPKNVFMKIARGGVPMGVVEFKLFDEIVPKTAHNFRELCRGSKRVQNVPLHYKGATFHRVIPKFMIQSGDFTNHNGTGGTSIYGRNFPDENFKLRHDRPFLLSMANRGPNTNGSQFFITTVPTPWLDGKHVVFGEVVAGKEVVKAIESTPTNAMDKPIQSIVITECGEVNEA